MPPYFFRASLASAKAQALAEFERAYLCGLLGHTRGNLSLAARVSQKDRGALKRLAKKHGIRASEFQDGESRSPDSEPMLAATTELPGERERGYSSMMSTSEWKLPWEGGCRCGAVRVRVTEPPLLAMACHCTGCQRMSSSAFSLSLAIPTPGFAVTKGEPVLGGIGGDLKHSFCDRCKTWMFTRMTGVDMFVNLRPTMLDDARWFVPFVETYTSEKLPWVSTPAVHSFEKFPEMNAFAELTADFAKRGVRPT